MQVGGPIHIRLDHNPTLHQGLLVTGFRLRRVGFDTQPADPGRQLTDGQPWSSINDPIHHMSGGLFAEMVGAVNKDVGPTNINITTMQQAPHPGETFPELESKPQFDRQQPDGSGGGLPRSRWKQTRPPPGL